MSDAELSVLGPLEAVRSGRPVALGPRQQRGLLALLAVRAGQLVSVEALVDALWPERPPASAGKIVQGYVSGLRKALGAEAIERRGAGYALRLAPGSLDLLRFQELTAEGGFAEALALWRGPALADVASLPGLRLEAERLEELRLRALEERIDADLVAGRHRDLVAELRTLVAAHPLRERLCGQLMLALYRSGRQAEALAVYQEARRVLVQELGIEPGVELKDLERRILAQEAGLALAEARSERALPGGTVTFLFTDVEGSTRLLHEMGAERYAQEAADHRRVLRAAFAAHRGVEVDTQGDSFFVAFATASEALAAAREAQASLRGGHLMVRMGVHTGTPLLTDEGYVGVDVNRAARMAAAGHGGQVLVSAATAALAGQEGLLDLGFHRLKDLLAPERIFQLGARDFPPLRSLHQTNLPVPATRFVGRTREVAEVTQLLVRRDVRVLTLTGPGGSGKTRLALQCAAEVAARYPDGVFWVALAELRDSALVLPTIARALETEQDVAADVGDKRMLLVLDNFEHVAVAAPEVVSLTELCPRLDLLVTSRARLAVAMEYVFRVPPLVEDDAISLFVERARATDTDFTMTAAVPEICRRLEGLPLAIELAAARVNVLAPVVILERLDRRLPVLSRGLRDAPDRQRTLEATITWSYDLLDEDQKSLFTRLSVFAGGWTLEAAEQVCSATLDQLASLIDNSLVRHNGNRYSMLETIREYTLERLRDSGELEAVERRHAAWYIRYVRNHRASAVRQAVGVTPLERELDNLRAALRRLATRGHVTGALRLAADLESLWISKAHLVEGREWLTDGLTYANVTPHVRARALRAAGWVTAHQGDHDAALTMLEHSLRIFRERNEKQFVASTLRRLGLLLTAIGQYECARSTLDEAVAAYTDAGDTTGRSTLANAFAVLAGYEGDLAAARTWLEEDLRHREDIGDRRGYGAILANLGMTAVLQGDYDAAEPLLEQALAIAYELGEAFDSANILATRGTLAIERGNIEQARRDFLTALKTYADARAKTRCAECFDGLGRVALANNEPVKAARLCAAAAATRERTGARLAIAEQKAIDDALASLAEQLDARAFAAAWQRGQTASLDEAVRYALETDVHDARTTPAR